MSYQDLIIASQLCPPQLRKNLLRRPRLESRLRSIYEYPLTIVQAGTGYGKTTSLAALPELGWNAFWYTIAEPDRDPLLFLVHLLGACKSYSEKAFSFLETNLGLVTPQALHPLINALTIQLREDTVLILDDFHHVADVDEIRELINKLVEFCPPRLHVVLSTRRNPGWPEINRWRVKGLLDIISANELAFTAEEIETLFKDLFDYPISSLQAARLAEDTEGWTIALQIIWQSIQTGIVPDIDTALKNQTITFDKLFDYLAPEVLSRQPAYLQKFLLSTSILSQMDGVVCDAILETRDSAEILGHLYEIGLFVDKIGEGTYRYQRLFQDFLQSELSKVPDIKNQLHSKAANHFNAAGEFEDYYYHLVKAGRFTEAADLIETFGERMVNEGRLESLEYWLGRLPEELQKSRPDLQLFIGNIMRLKAGFDKALSAYDTAYQLYQKSGDLHGQSRSLRGQAQVYLDTVRPIQASALLANAMQLLDPQTYPQEISELLDQQAENRLNSGFPDQSMELHRQAMTYRKEKMDTDAYLEGRILLRTGRLTEAHQLLSDSIQKQPETHISRQMHFHREKQLLLSLVEIMRGNQKEAEDFARQGIELGHKHLSEYVAAVGLMRLGHCMQLDSFTPWGKPDQEEAKRCYQEVLEKIKPFNVAKVRVEPLWGLCRVHGYSGDIEAAEVFAQRAIEIATTAGDEWVGNLARISMGASLAMAGRNVEAARMLRDAAEGFSRVQDKFAWCAAQVWLALNAWWKSDPETALRHLSACLSVIKENGFNYLLLKRTHLGLRDDQNAIPLLIEAGRQNIETGYIKGILIQICTAPLSHHPGYTIRVRTLGGFELWRGNEPISPREWKREKGRQLFQLLLSRRGKMHLKDQLIEMLWPDLPASAAARDFKVALNALNKVLEPSRPQSQAPFFVVRDGEMYGINPCARVETDADVFIRLCETGEIAGLNRAIELYRGDYLPDCTYQDWSADERDQLHAHYLHAVEKLADDSLKRHSTSEAIDLCKRALTLDKYWEAGYVLLMQGYGLQGKTAQVQAVYQRWEQICLQDLGVEVSASTRELYRKLTQPQAQL